MCWNRGCRKMRVNECKYYHFCPKNEECRYYKCKHIHLTPENGLGEITANVKSEDTNRKYNDTLKMIIAD